MNIIMNGQRWTYDAEKEQFTALAQAGASEPVYRTYADWERIFPA